MLLTRKDICVSCRICSVGRKKPKFIHIERLSALVKWVQAHPKRLMYRAFQREGRTAAPSPHQRAYADSAFKKADSAGHAMRGSSHILCLGVTTQHLCVPLFVMCWTTYLASSDVLCGQRLVMSFSMVATRLTKPRFWISCCMRLKLAIVLRRERDSDAAKVVTRYQQYNTSTRSASSRPAQPHT